MNCLKKRAMFITAGFLGIGGYILYQNLKSRVDDLEEEIWGMEESELEACPYCDRVYTMECETCDDLGDSIEHTKAKEVKGENYNNELHDEVQNYLEHVEEEKDKYDKDEK
ncbi:hypothetical protein [Romboutsia ilealis]|uniref:hypothetical protein n=1 Tax=Romboutsia ilealis TaxID=1115758 RepID=UPI00257226F5|nr:hypothetical protein [Romboutsia ilealis]